MKRKIERKVENSKKSRPVGTRKTRHTPVGGDHAAWAILISKLDPQSQLKLLQQNKRLANIVELNAESKLRKFRRQIENDRYMYVF